MKLRSEHILIVSMWLNNCPSEFKPMLYRRYVDDSFLLFRSESHKRLFLDYLNVQYQSIKFTHESERNSYLPFLDVNLMKNEHGFETTLFRKDTLIGLTTKYNSAPPHRYKVILMQCLCIVPSESVRQSIYSVKS